MSFQHFHITSKSSAWFPTNLPGCILWLDAGQGITKDGSNYISLFADQSGQANNASQATGANQPLWVDNQLNGKPIVRFDGSNDFMEFASGFMYNWTDVSLFIVLKHPYSPNNAVFGYSAGWGQGVLIYSANGGGYLNINGGNKYTDFLKNNQWAISDFVYNSTSLNAYVNGVSLGAVGGGAPLSLNGVYALGKYAGSTSYCAAFDIAEMIIYDNSLSDVNRRTVEKYLAAKYGFFYNEIPVMTSDTTPSGVVTYSSQYGGYEAWKLFDYGVSSPDFWITYAALPQWVAYEFPTAKTIKKYALTAWGNADQQPKDWKFQGWDGANWIDLDVVTNEPVAVERRVYTIDTPASYIKYRLYITAASGVASGIYLLELEMSET